MKIHASVNADDIKNYFRGVKSTTTSLFEFGIHDSRFDLIRIDTWKQKIKGFEFKITKADFNADKKWPNYLKYCHSLTFVCPEGLITIDDLPSHIGILYVRKWKHDIDNAHWFYRGRWVRKPRNQELSKDKYIEVISLLLNRTKWRWKEFF